MPDVLDLTPGTRLWFRGAVWTCTSIDGPTITVTRGTQAIAVTVAALASQAHNLEPLDDENLPVNMLLSSLTAKSRQEIEERARHIRELLAEDDGNPDTLKARLAGKAAELGTSIRTLQRWVAGYRAKGEAGLIDSRILQERASQVDPRWDKACLDVLARYTNASTPTKNVVIDEIRHDLTARYGEGIVPIPSQATAYRRLDELSKGRHTFGSGKNRRSVAGRPKGPYGRLRATRPGECDVRLRLRQRVPQESRESVRTVCDTYFCGSGGLPMVDVTQGPRGIVFGPCGCLLVLLQLEFRADRGAVVGGHRDLVANAGFLGGLPVLNELAHRRVIAQ